MRLLIIGSEGLIGTHLQQVLQDCEFDFFTLDLSESADFSIDVLDLSALKEVFHEVAPSHVINLAALSSNKQCIANPSIVYRLNTVLPAVLMQYMQLVGAKRLVHASTEWIYGPGSKSILNGLEPEHYLLADHDLYSRSKVDAEVLIKALSNKDLTSVCLRLGIVYGSELKASNCIVDVLINQLLNNQVPTVRDANAARCFVSALDVSRSFVSALDIELDSYYIHYDIQGPYCHTLGSIVDYMSGSVDSLHSINDVSDHKDAKVILNQSDSKLMINPTSLADYIDARLSRP